MRPEVTTDRAFIDDFIDDYFSECEEHLATVRRTLLAFDEAGDRPIDPPQLQELLRALHTLKGLSGMVGLSAAEEVAHAMEDGLRAVPESSAVPRNLLDTLFAGVTRLEEAVVARRARINPPSPGAFVDQVRDVIASMQSTTGGRDIVHVRTEALTRFRFAASAALLARGVGVEVIRQRLASIGKIIQTTPVALPTGSVVFEFTVKLPTGVEPPDEWRDDALSWELAEQVMPVGVGLVVHSNEPMESPRPVAAVSSNVVRVDLARLDDLMRMVGELVVSRARLSEAVRRAHGQLTSSVEEDLTDANAAIERQLRGIREGVMRVRLVAVNEVFERLRFAMRDVARETQKSIHLEFVGQETEIDKLVIDRMLEPLLHLVRNSASHGIESRNDRVANGKSPDGTIVLRAHAAGDRIVLQVEDDGAGIDVVRVEQRAVAAGLIPPNEALTPDVLLDVLCSSGFSTRDSADMTSGRGVGMAVVRDTIRAIGGTLFLDSTLGRGTRFTIELPLTLMITDALVMAIGDQSMAIPQISLREIVPLEGATITRVENNEVLTYRGRVIPLVDLGARFNFQPRPGAKRHALIVGSESHEAGLIVDGILGLREIVVHPVTDPLVAIPGISGATELADGRVSLVLDAAALVRVSRERTERTAARMLPLSREPAATLGWSATVSEKLWS